MMDPTETMGEYFAGWKQDRQRRHATWHKDNRALIADSGWSYEDRGEALLFRDPTKPPADFYPSTGRWRTMKPIKTHSGGAAAFLAWYERA